MVYKCCVKNCNNRNDQQHREKGIRFYKLPDVVTTKGPEMEDLTRKQRSAWLAALQLSEDEESEKEKKEGELEKTKKSEEIEKENKKSPAKFACSDHFVKGQRAYIRDVNSPSWKPTLKLGHHQPDEVDSISCDTTCSPQEGKTSIEGRASAADCAEGTVIWIYPPEPALSGENSAFLEGPQGCAAMGASGDGGPGEVGRGGGAVNAPPAPEIGSDGGAYCQTDVTALSTLTTEEEKMLRTELNRLLVENAELKEKLSEREMSLDSLQGNDDTVRYFTGLPDFVVLSSVFGFVSDHLPSDPRRVLSPFQAFILTLMHLRLNTPLQHLAYIFCVSRSTVSKAFHETLHVLYCRLKPLVFWPDRESIRASLPAQFLERPWRRTVSIIDCFEVFIERPSCADAAALTWSHYKHHNTIKYLISITPQGYVSFISKGWGGRASDKNITESCGYLNNLLPNDLVLADRGFDIFESVALCQAEVRIPAFTRGKSQLSAKEVESTRKLAHLRIHVERVIGLLCGKFTILNETVPIPLLLCREGETVTSLDKIVTVGCALVNLCPGIV